MAQLEAEPAEAVAMQQKRITLRRMAIDRLPTGCAPRAFGADTQLSSVQNKSVLDEIHPQKQVRARRRAHSIAAKNVH